MLMSLLKMILIFSFIVTRVLSEESVEVQKVADDQKKENTCEVTQIFEKYAVLDCGDMNLEQAELYGEDGTTHKISTKFQEMYLVNHVKDKTEVGSVLYLNPKRVKSRVFMESLYSAMNPFAAQSFNIYLNAFSYSHSSFDGSLTEGSNSFSLENNLNEFKTLPLDLQIELSFEEVMLVLTPRFDEMSGGISLLKRINNLSVGVFADVDVQDTKTKIVFNNQNIDSGQVSESDFSVGLAFRYNESFDHWDILSQLKLGYAKTKEKYTDANSSVSSVTLDAGFAEFDFYSYYKISHRFLLGAGLSLMYGKGSFEYSEPNFVMSDDLKAFSIKAIPLSLKLSF